MNSKQNSRSPRRRSADQKMADGTAKYLSQLASLPVGGGTYTPAEIVQIFKDRIASNKAVQTVTAQRAAAVKADDDKRAQTGPTVRAFRRMVQGNVFGIAGYAGCVRARAHQGRDEGRGNEDRGGRQRLATRAARHTMGRGSARRSRGRRRAPVRARRLRLDRRPRRQGRRR